MAEVKKNPFTKGLSGAVGDYMVFRRVGKQTFVSTAPVRNDEVSDKQKAVRERFQMATIYARSVDADPALKEQYESKALKSKKRSWYHVAMADFFHAPEIEEIDISAYSGVVGSTIRVRAYDIFKVQSVKVEIYSQEGTLVEKGLATQQTNQLDWLNTASVENAQLAGDRIVIKATDLPGNISEQETTYT